ncbi:MAG: Dabb family protein [Eubacterium sp.]|nr:Dabb family protein [Eubacterium sp.]
MIKHVILWQLKDELDQSQKTQVRANIKKGLEDLQGVVPGLVDIHVQIDMLDTSNADVMLDSSFETVEALKGYAVHPAHVKVAEEAVKPYTKSRVCMDFEV